MGNYAGPADAEPLDGLPFGEPLDIDGENYAGGGTYALKPESPAPLSGSALYLREILASEESLRAAFEPVLRAARCPVADDLVDRSAFACAVNRIVGYFNPAEPIGLRGPSFGPPYSVDEALGHFCTVLGQLAARLEELERPDQQQQTIAPPAPLSQQQQSQLLRPPIPVELGASVSPAVPATTGSSEGVEASLEASRARVAGLRRALGREEELLRHQAEETLRLEHLQRDLEAEAEAAARRRAAATAARTAARGSADKSRHETGGASASMQPQWPRGDAETDAQAWPLGSLNGAERRSPRGTAEEDEGAAVDMPLGGPMSLEDVKYHLRTVLRLKRRVVELEGALDGREEQVAVLYDELNRRSAALAARVTAV